MHIHIHIYTYTQIHIYIYTYLHICIYTQLANEEIPWTPPGGGGGEHTGASLFDAPRPAEDIDVTGMYYYPK